jgi:Na+/H+ antiporter NhaD/arsenite permease-like protein
MVLPFALLLALIAFGPLCFAAFWERHYPKIALGLGGLTAAYYLAGLQAGGRVAHTAGEYASFIALVGSLFVVSGGIHIRVKGEATPVANVVFLAIGGLLANVLGTTGASMLLIRPWLRMNRYRVTEYHVVFFIFIVSNVGGALTPIGDPPLYLGYLNGVPFWWVAQKCCAPWVVAMVMLLSVFYALDRGNFLRAPRGIREQQTAEPEHWKFDGLGNLVFLGVILGAVFVNEPRGLREALMIGAGAGSYFTTRRAVHEANGFNFHPVREVAVLFAGIFATMMPALDWLQANASSLGDPGTTFYYWGSGLLSSVLDNAPTYLSFFSAALGSSVRPEWVVEVEALVRNGGADLGSVAEPVRLAYGALLTYQHSAVASGRVSREAIQTAFLIGDPALARHLMAISLGAVFFGANTYIGNGPNFMVKAIAQQQRVHAPDFLGYVWRFALPFLLPALVVVWLAFMR